MQNRSWDALWWIKTYKVVITIDMKPTWLDDGLSAGSSRLVLALHHLHQENSQAGQQAPHSRSAGGWRHNYHQESRECQHSIIINRQGPQHQPAVSHGQEGDHDMSQEPGRVDLCQSPGTVTSWRKWRNQTIETVNWVNILIMIETVPNQPSRPLRKSEPLYSISQTHFMEWNDFIITNSWCSSIL